MRGPFTGNDRLRDEIARGLLDADESDSRLSSVTPPSRRNDIPEGADRSDDVNILTGGAG